MRMSLTCPRGDNVARKRRRAVHVRRSARSVLGTTDGSEGRDRPLDPDVVAGSCRGDAVILRDGVVRGSSALADGRSASADRRRRPGLRRRCPGPTRPVSDTRTDVQHVVPNPALSHGFRGVRHSLGRRTWVSRKCVGPRVSLVVRLRAPPVPPAGQASCERQREERKQRHGEHRLLERFELGVRVVGGDCVGLGLGEAGGTAAACTDVGRRERRPTPSDFDQASAFCLIWSNSVWLIVPASSNVLAFAICSAGSVCAATACTCWSN